MEKIKKEVDEFRKINGNNDLSNKDMLMYLVQRVDKLEVYVRNRFDDGSGKIGGNTTKIVQNSTRIKGIITFLIYFCSIGIPILFTLLSWLILNK